MALLRAQPMAGHHNKWQEIESCRYQRNPFFHGSTLDFLFHLFIVCNGCWIEDRLSAHTIKEKLKEKSCCPSGRKPFHKIRSHGWHHHWITEERPEVNARRSKGNRRRAPKVFFLIRWCWRGSLVERIENVKSWKTARSLLNERRKERERLAVITRLHFLSLGDQSLIAPAGDRQAHFLVLFLYSFWKRSDCVRHLKMRLKPSHTLLFFKKKRKIWENEGCNERENYVRNQRKQKRKIRLRTFSFH